MDARELAEAYLVSLGISLQATEHQMFNIRECPTAPELLVATRKLQVQLHPDTRHLILWAHRTYDPEACPFDMVKEAEDILDDFYKRWKETKDNLVNLDHKNHTKDWSTHGVSLCLSLPLPCVVCVYVCVYERESVCVCV